MRRASEVDGFPYNSRRNCYIIINENGELEQIRYTVQAMKDLYTQVVNNNLNIFIVWPGNYTSDIFLVDDMNAFGRAFKK